ncbi:MAG: hypothetical protein E6J43_09150 [Chloroflexi bacterium]|nr:MAG: hypothetical protein E6J43_09150 [Chloroflexota bacterium]
MDDSVANTQAVAADHIGEPESANLAAAQAVNEGEEAGQRLTRVGVRSRPSAVMRRHVLG